MNRTFTRFSPRCASRLLSIAFVGLYAGAVHAQSVPPTPAATSSDSAPASSANAPFSPRIVLPGNPSVEYYVLPFVPMPRHGGLLVHTRLNGKTGATFILDTGADTSIVRADVADALGLTREKNKTDRKRYGYTTNEFESVNIERIQLGQDINLGGYFVVSDAVMNVLGDKSIAGIFSGDGFLDNSLLFDFDHLTVAVIPKGHLSESDLNALGMAKGTKAISMKPTDNSDLPLFTVKARVVGSGKAAVDEDLILDTGSNNTYFTDEPAHLNLSPLVESPYALVGEAGSGTACRVDSLQVLGDNLVSAASLSQVVCNFRKETSVVENKGRVLGMDFLSHFRVLIDYPARKLYLSPLIQGNKILFPTESARVNGQRLIDDAVFQPSSTGRWAVQYLTGGGGYFATKGLRSGDVLTAIQGKPTDGLLPDEMAAQIVNNIDTLKLTILRDGKEIVL